MIYTGTNLCSDVPLIPTGPEHGDCGSAAGELTDF